MKSSLINVSLMVVLAVLIAHPGYGENAAGELKLVFLIDFDDFMCFSCLESFVDFCHALPGDFRKDHCLGVLVYPAGRELQAGFIQIMEKKLRGFTQANRIDFPVVIDRPRFFSGRIPAESCVLVFRPGGQNLEVYPFPLSRKAAGRILADIRRR